MICTYSMTCIDNFFDIILLKLIDSFSNSVDERIFKLQQDKIALSNATYTPENADVRRQRVRDILALLGQPV